MECVKYDLHVGIGETHVPFDWHHGIDLIFGIRCNDQFIALDVYNHIWEIECQDSVDKLVGVRSINDIDCPS